MIAWDEQPLQKSGMFTFSYDQDDLKTPLDDTMADVNEDYDEATVVDEVIEPDPPSRKSSDVQSESSSVKSRSRRRRRFGRNK